MTQDEIIEMARQAGYFVYDLTETHQKKTVETDEADEWAQLERFAKLVAQHEREACADICKSWLGRYPAIEIMNAIRARGQS